MKAVLAEIMRRLKGWFGRPAPLWTGIYRQFADVLARGPAYESAEWIRQSERALLARRKQTPAASPLPPPAEPEHLLLPFLISLLSQRQETVRVLDFGGGIGLSYQHVLESVPDGTRLDYHIVENKPLCAAAPSAWPGDSRIHFHDAIPAIPSVDIVYICSALQYVEDYRGLCKRLCETFRPAYFLFAKLSAGDIPTYVTAQINMAGSAIPYRFLNFEEILQIMRENRYYGVYRSTLERGYQQSNFPDRYRLAHACNVMFMRDEHGKI